MTRTPRALRGRVGFAATVALGFGAAFAVEYASWYRAVGVRTGFEFVAGSTRWILIAKLAALSALGAAALLRLAGERSVAIVLAGLALAALGLPAGAWAAEARFAREVEAARRFCEALVPALELEFGRAGEFPAELPRSDDDAHEKPRLIADYEALGRRFYDVHEGTFRFTVYDQEWWHHDRRWRHVEFGL